MGIAWWKTPGEEFSVLCKQLKILGLKIAADMFMPLSSVSEFKFPNDRQWLQHPGKSGFQIGNF